MCDNTKSSKGKQRDLSVTTGNKDAFDFKKWVSSLNMLFYPFISLTDDCFFQNTKDE